MAVNSGSDMLRNAAKVIEDRHKTYGPPARNFQTIADLWNAYYPSPPGDEFTQGDVALMMALVKIARLAETPDHLDSWTDIAGYAACGVEVSCAESSATRAEHASLRPVATLVQEDEGRADDPAPDKFNPSMPLVSEDVIDAEGGGWVDVSSGDLLPNDLSIGDMIRLRSGARVRARRAPDEHLIVGVNQPSGEGARYIIAVGGVCSEWRESVTAYKRVASASKAVSEDDFNR